MQHQRSRFRLQTHTHYLLLTTKKKLRFWLTDWLTTDREKRERKILLKSNRATRNERVAPVAAVRRDGFSGVFFCYFNRKRFWFPAFCGGIYHRHTVVQQFRFRTLTSSRARARESSRVKQIKDAYARRWWRQTTFKTRVDIIHYLSIFIPTTSPPPKHTPTQPLIYIFVRSQ